MTSNSPYPDFSPPDVSLLLENAKKWKESFNKPLPLGVKKSISIITCMVSVLLAAMHPAAKKVQCVPTHESPCMQIDILPSPLWCTVIIILRMLCLVQTERLLCLVQCKNQWQQAVAAA